MDKLKMVDELIEHTNISYEEAKSALEKCNWNILDAIAYVESIETYYTNGEKKKENTKEEKPKNEYNNAGFFDVIVKWVDTLNNIFLEVMHKGKLVIKLPITIIILLMFFTFWITVPIMFIGLFLNVRYKFYSKKKDVTKWNDVLDKVNGWVEEMDKE